MQHHETVDALIERVASQHPGQSPAALARYFEAVHQELAPLARSLEAENQRMREQLQGDWVVVLNWQRFESSVPDDGGREDVPVDDKPVGTVLKLVSNG